jgi:uncharacterized membrane protein
MSDEIEYTETHARTIAKLVAYRVVVTIGSMLLVLAVGGSNAQAGSVGLVVLVAGSIIYYLHDRAWILTRWARSADATDAQSRSILKTVIYRFIVMAVGIVLFKLLGLDNEQSAWLVVSTVLLNMSVYYAVERIFNSISWGKKPVVPVL